MKRPYVVWFEEVDKEDIALVGGKGANLGEMTGAHLAIPYGFIVTSHAYYHFLEKEKLKTRIRALLEKLDHTDADNLHKTATAIRELILSARVPDELSQSIAQYYDQLYQKEKKVKGIAALSTKLKAVYDPPLVAVRSSATAEDLPDASFAGQQETFLNIQGEASVVDHVKSCWASLFTDRAVFYRAEKGFDHFKVGLAAVVQRMVQSEKSGILFTVDPVTNDKNVLVIEAIFGLGEYIVQGKVTPDQYLVDKKNMVILKKKVATQDVQFIKKGKRTIESPLHKSMGGKQKITDQLIIRIAQLGRKIEKHYYFPQDIEWAIEKGEIFITQSRPITTLDEKNKSSSAGMTTRQKILLEGDSASPGIATGEIVQLLSPKEISKIHTGDILVAKQTNPDYVPAMKRACAIVTEHGGRTSHAAIVSRELGIPCIVGVENVMSVLKNGLVATVNGSTGKIYSGKVEMQQETRAHIKFKTKTHIYLNVGEPDRVHELASMPVDGVGLLRAEFMIANIGEHPKSLLKKGKGNLFIDSLAKGVSTIAKAFYPRQVVYRTTDFKTNEYRFLKGGRNFEPAEENPMLGYRGAFRYISEPEVFALEIAALKKAIVDGSDNIAIMIPFVRSPQHLIQAKAMMEKGGLHFGKKLKLWMMVELPVNIILLDTFLDAGVDGVSIGSNDLTMLTLGVDRDNEALAQLYDERNDAVKWAIGRTIDICNARGITSSICGQSVSDYPELLEFVVKRGITSVSISPDAFWRVNEEIHTLELHGKR